MNLPFKVPEWYDPDKNMTRSLDWANTMFSKLGISLPAKSSHVWWDSLG